MYAVSVNCGQTNSSNRPQVAAALRVAPPRAADGARVVSARASEGALRVRHIPILTKIPRYQYINMPIYQYLHSPTRGQTYTNSEFVLYDMNLSDPT
jgi:hypothetical protein